MMPFQSQKYDVLENETKCEVEQEPQVEKDTPKNQDPKEMEHPSSDDAPSIPATVEDPVVVEYYTMSDLCKCFDFGPGNITSLIIGSVCIVASPFLDIDYHPELALIGVTIIVCAALTVLFPRGCLSGVKYKRGKKPKPKSKPNPKPKPVSPTPTSSVIAALDDLSSVMTQRGTMDEEAENPVEQSWLQKIAAYIKNHIFFINFFVLNVVCLIAVGIYVKEKPTKEIIMIYNAVFLGCALLSQFTTRGLFAKIPLEARRRKPYNSRPGSPSRPSPEELSGKLEEVKDESPLSPIIPVVSYKKAVPSMSSQESDKSDSQGKSASI